MSVLMGNVVFFVLGEAGYKLMMEFWLALHPLAGTPYRGAVGVVMAETWPWQLLSYGFLHGNLTHLFFNMFALWMFGTQIENLWGSRAFAVYYLVCIIGAALVQLLVLQLQGSGGVTVGASGGVFGILLAYGMMFPNRTIMLLIPPIPMKAKYFVVLYGVLELVFGVSGARTGVAHFAHLGGMLFGLALILYWNRRSRFRR